MSKSVSKGLEFTFWLIVLTQFSVQGKINGFSKKYDYGPNYYLDHTQEQGEYGYGESPTPNFGGQNDLQTQFLNLFNENGVTKMAESCSPRFTQDLTAVSHMCSKDDFFFGMFPLHIDAVQAVTGFMAAPSTPEGNLCVASQLKHGGDINPNVWIQSLMSTVIHSPELSALQRPSLVEIFPSMVVSSYVMNEAKRLATLPPNMRGNDCIVLDGGQGERNGPENALWYWREDVMLNSHHWYWHLSNPFMSMAMPGQRPSQKPDRRGELFYYFHQGLLARYHSERLSNGLRKVVPLEIDYSTIPEPYYPNLDGSNSGMSFTSRPPNSLIQDIYFNRIPDSPMNISVAERSENWRRILDSVASGSLLTPNDEYVSLDNRNGIDLLGEVVEASVYSTNPSYYGAFGVHNAGHIILSLINDPEGRRGLPQGVIGNTATAMRDPIFYTYHTRINKVFDKHKYYLPPYNFTEGEFPLLWPGVTIAHVDLIPLNKRRNDLTTYFNHVTYDLSRGLDFNRSDTQGPINVCLRHLDYEHFEYQIAIKMIPNSKSNTASIRIFMAPAFDEFGRRYTFFDQRTLFFPMDYFTARLEPGENFIRRRSVDSSLTISWPQRLEQLERDIRRRTPDCGCGHPQHLLLPKGTPEGMAFDLFVMATNGEEDAVPYKWNPVINGPRRPPSCRSAPIYCGVLGQLYPDTKPMGYPFDRPTTYSTYGENGGYPYAQAPRLVNSIEEFVAALPNSAITRVRITHLDS